MRGLFRSSVAIVAALVVALAACSSNDDEPAPTAEGTPTEAPQTPIFDENFAAYEEFWSLPVACGADRPDPVTPMTFEKPGEVDLDFTKPVSVTIETSCGDIGVEMNTDGAPIAVFSFIYLAEQGFFDGMISHRIMPGFMFQAGDQTATGFGDAGYKILVDEYPQSGFSYDRGVVAMANAGPGSSGSQFFIMLGSSALPPQFTVIGRVVSGDEVLDSIAAIPIAARPDGEESLPQEALFIERILVAEQ